MHQYFNGDSTADHLVLNTQSCIRLQLPKLLIFVEEDITLHSLGWFCFACIFYRRVGHKPCEMCDVRSRSPLDALRTLSLGVITEKENYKYSVNLLKMRRKKGLSLLKPSAGKY